MKRTGIYISQDELARLESAIHGFSDDKVNLRTKSLYGDDEGPEVKKLVNKIASGHGVKGDAVIQPGSGEIWETEKKEVPVKKTEVPVKKVEEEPHA